MKPVALQAFTAIQAFRLQSPFRRALSISTAYIAGYIFLDWISYIFPIFPLGITPWNPPPGATLFLLLRFGLGYWPAVPLAYIASDYAVNDYHSFAPLVFATAGVTAIYTSAAAVLKRVLSGSRELASGRDLAWFITVTMISTLLVASTYISIYMAFGKLHWSDFFPQFTKFWIGDIDGIIVITPLLLTLEPRRIISFQWSKTTLLALQALAVALALWIVFFKTQAESVHYFYILFLPLIWISAMHGIRGAALALIAFQLGLIMTAEQGNHTVATFTQLQILMLMLGITGLALGVFVTQRAATEAKLREKQAQLSRALQLGAAGEMSSALAHELNQPIAAIANYLESCLLLEEAQADTGTIRDVLRKASREARRAGDIVSRIRDFFRAGALALEPVDLHRLLRELIASLQYRADRAAVKFDLKLDADPSTIMADALQLESVLNNLLLNAIEALEIRSRPERIIWLSTSCRVGFVEIAVEDNGAGIHPDLLGNLFEPFNTNKLKGMGMGLAISRSIIEAHGGRLGYRPRAGGGSLFLCSLPIEADSAHPAEPQ